jgi:hypothetical protein
MEDNGCFLKYIDDGKMKILGIVVAGNNNQIPDNSFVVRS